MTIASRSWVGILTKLLVKENGEIFCEAINLLVDHSLLVQEGMACYAEYRLKNSSNKEITAEEFLIGLKDRGKIYCDGFKIASKINSILNPENLSFIELTSQEVFDIRKYCLIDLSRFALNAPIIDALGECPNKELHTKISQYLASHNPAKRWLRILSVLESDQPMRDKFIDSAKDIITTWVLKDRNHVKAVKGNIISLDDNVESIVSELFPDLAYKPIPYEELRLKAPEISDTQLQYYAASVPHNIRFNLNVPIEQSSFDNYEQIEGFVSHFIPGDQKGCYCRIFLNYSNESRYVRWHNSNIGLEIPCNYSAVLFQEAYFTKNQYNNGRIWNYSSAMKCALFPNSKLLGLLSLVRSDDIVISIDVDLNSPNPFSLLSQLDDLKIPIFLTYSPFGSFKSFHKVITNDALKNTEALFFFQKTSADGYEHVNPNFVEFWIIPKTSNNNIGIFSHCTPDLANVIINYSNLEGFGSHVDLKVGGTFFCTLSSLHHGSAEPFAPGLNRSMVGLWSEAEKNSGFNFYGPLNADIAMMHLMAFGL
jgi:hypothetical protein